MFAGYSRLQNIDTSSFKTDKVQYMQHMFEGCSKLESIDVSGFKGTAVIDMSSMLADCKNLETLNFEKMYTPELMLFNHVFRGC